MPYWSRLTVLARSGQSTATKSSAAAMAAGAVTAAGAVARFTTLMLLIKAAWCYRGFSECRFCYLILASFIIIPFSYVDSSFQMDARTLLPYPFSSRQ